MNENHHEKKFVSAMGRGPDWKKSLKSVTARIKKELGERSCDLVVFFVSGAAAPEESRKLLGAFGEALACRVRIGCNASGVIGSEREIEMEAAFSVLAMHLPGVRLSPFYLSPERAQGLREPNDLVRALDVFPTENPRFLLLADPMSFDVTNVLRHFNQAYKGSPVIGGLSSGRLAGAASWLDLNGVFYEEGAVGVGLSGPIDFETLVSQGCRPVGKPLVITKAEDNVLYELAGRTALEAANEVVSNLSERDKRIAQGALFAGLAMDEHKSEFLRGDFLIRNIMGYDPKTGALVIGEMLRVGQTLQFQLRDSETSEEDLVAMLGKMKAADETAPRGAILVSCCGRGKELYGRPDHDLRLVQAARGPLPMTGFFASGEIGPVASKNFAHGYTSSLVILS